MSTIKVTNITPQSGNTVFLTGSLTVSDTLIAREVRTELTQSAVLFQSGSTKFGDDTTDTHQFTGSIVTSGSFRNNGPVTLEGIPWPAIGSEVHLLETEPFTVNLPSGDRTYDYIGIGLEHFETGSIYHNSLLIYAYDQHHGGGGPNFGTEFNVGPVRNHMRVYPSGSTSGLDIVNMANISVEDLQNGTTQALVYGNEVHLGVYRGDHIRLGNLNSSVTQSYSDGLYNGTSLRIHNTSTAISGTLDLQGIGNVSSSIATLYDSSSALNGRITTNEFNIDNHYTETNAFTASTNTRLTDLESFSSSLDSTYATDAELNTATSSLSASLATDIQSNILELSSLRAVTGSYATTSSVQILSDQTGSYATTSSVQILSDQTASYATTGSNTFTGNQVVSSSVLLTLEPVVTPPSPASTGSLIVSGSPVQLYIYNGSGSTGWNKV